MEAPVDSDACRPWQGGHARNNSELGTSSDGPEASAVERAFGEAVDATDVVPTTDPTSGQSQLKIVAAAYRQPDAIPALIQVLGESDNYLAGESSRVWRSLVVLHKLGEPINREGLARCLEDFGEPNIERTLDDVERVAASFKGDNPGAAALRRAQELVKAAGAADVKIEAVRKTPIKYFVTTYRDDMTLHVDLVELGKSDKRDALAAKIVEASGLTLDDVHRRLIDVMELADAVADEQAQERGGAPEKQADLLVGLCKGVTLEHDADNVAYATWQHAGARQTHRIRTGAFKTWLAWKAYTDLELVPNSNAMQEALTTLVGAAVHNGALIQVYRRVAEHDDRLYLDLCNEGWQAVEVDAAGWRVVSEPPVRFIRGTGMLPLPEPVKGALGALHPFLNVVEHADFEICLGWLIGAVQPRGPFPILALSGRQGSAKSCAAKLLIALIDPNKAPLRSAPKSEDDLVVAAQHSRAICFDNVSHLSPDLSDSLCRLATGGGVAKRKLYSDDEAVILDAQAPLVLTGIGSYITRGDAADRALPVGLRPLRDSEYRPERELLAEFEAARPGILGGLLDALSCSIRRRDEVAGTSRMADFERAVEAAGPALGWQPGHFNRLMAHVRDRSRREHIQDDELAQALIRVAPWTGTVERLRGELSGHANAREWLPKTAKSLGNAIRRLEPMLEHVGLEVTRAKRGDERLLCLEWAPGKKAPNAPEVSKPAPSTASVGGTSGGTSARESVGNVLSSAQAPLNVPAQKALEVNAAAHRAHGAHADDTPTFTDEELGQMADEAALRRAR